ncbi:hypothetical protein [Archangium sp.]|uniref:hypothetical protein n=1 Tax=Archangium sp. TaxID=1872627 RepID=UPI00389AD4F7
MRQACSEVILDRLPHLKKQASWTNTTRLQGDLAAEVRELKAGAGPGAHGQWRPRLPDHERAVDFGHGNVLRSSTRAA